MPRSQARVAHPNIPLALGFGLLLAAAMAWPAHAAPRAAAPEPCGPAVKATYSDSAAPSCCGKMSFCPQTLGTAEFERKRTRQRA